MIDEERIFPSQNFIPFQKLSLSAQVVVTSNIPSPALGMLLSLAIRGRNIKSDIINLRGPENYLFNTNIGFFHIIIKCHPHSLRCLTTTVFVPRLVQIACTFKLV